MSGFKGDYMGFTYNDKHSSDLGIVRVSDGSRFNENLLPTMQDKTVQVPGGDGSYFFGSHYTQRPFSISFAFDGLTEENLANLKRHFGDKQIHDLIFDETPYKVYSAKVTGTATLKYIPFAEGETGRLYKGEGTIQFTCFYPFARCRFMGKTIDALEAEYSNINEWWSASRIGEGGNFGDIPVPFKLALSGKGGGETFLGKLTWDLPENITGVLDTRTGLVLSESGDILNQYVTGDVTVKIPIGETGPEGAEFTCEYI